MVIPHGEERDAPRAEQVLVGGDRDVVDPVDDVVQPHEWDAVGRVEQDLRPDRLGALDDVPNRQDPTRLHLDEAQRDERGPWRDRLDEPIDVVDVDHLDPALARHEEREQDRGELGRRHDHAIAGSEVGGHETNTDRHGRHQRNTRTRRPDQAPERGSRPFGPAVPFHPDASAGLPGVLRLAHRAERRVRW